MNCYNKSIKYRLSTLGIAMIFLHTADLHIEKENDIEILEKIIKIALEKTCTDILIAGDLFETDKLGRILASNVARTFSQFNGNIWIIPGNHDRQLPEYLSISKGKLFSEIELINLDNNTDLLAIPYSEDSFNDLVNEHKLPKSDKKVIALMHGTLYDNAFFYNDENHRDYFPISYDKLSSMNYLYSALGHYHSYMQFENHNFVVNPGSPRVTRSSDFGRRLVTVFNTETLELHKIPIDTKYHEEISLKTTFIMKLEHIVNMVEENLRAIITKEDFVANYLSLQVKLTGTVSMTQEEQNELEKRLNELFSKYKIESKISLTLKSIGEDFLKDPMVSTILSSNDDEDFQDYAISVLSDIYTGDL